MKRQSKIQEKLLKLTASVAHKEAEKTADSACIFVAYQPKEPKQLKSLKK